MKEEHGLREDAKNLSLIGGTAALAALVTVGLLAAQIAKPEAEPYRVVIETKVTPQPAPEPVVVEVEVAPEPVVEETPEPVVVEPVRRLTGSDRIYGEVLTKRGRTYTGFVRWDRNEGSWTDLLEATKLHGRRGGGSLGGIRFGHVDRIVSTGNNTARFYLRSGEQTEMQGNATDLGRGLRALIVSDEHGDVAEMKWGDLDEIRFLAVPDGLTPRESRIYGTLMTRTGLQFTGYITWDVDEIYSTDVLDGDNDDGQRMKIPFGDIAWIERFGSGAARVGLVNGEELVLDGTNDVNSSNSGISVSDGNLGQVKLPWNEFDIVRFHAPATEAQFVDFDGGRPLHGTVVTESGEQITGDIVWDGDEAFTWEILNGDAEGLDFSIEFSNVASIERGRDGSTVTLKDGRTFDLRNSNDVGSGNRGIEVRADGRTYDVRWSDLREVVFER